MLRRPIPTFPDHVSQNACNCKLKNKSVQFETQKAVGAVIAEAGMPHIDKLVLVKKVFFVCWERLRTVRSFGRQ